MVAYRKNGTQNPQKTQDPMRTHDPMRAQDPGRTLELFFRPRPIAV